MGAVCGCASLEKANTSRPGDPGDEEELSDEGSEVQASSDEDDDQEGVRQGVADILTSTGKNLKRGKTMAMKEAISTAKKVGLESSKITEAEKRLEEHKRQQRRDEVEQEVTKFVQSAAYRDIQMVDKMIHKAQDAECSTKSIESLQEHLKELVETRDLEEHELQEVREYVKRSCRELVVATTQGDGRPVSLLKLEDGARTPASLTLDPSLQRLGIVEEGGAAAEVALASVKPVRGKDDKKASKSNAFSDLARADRDCVLCLNYDDDGNVGSWCVVEPSSIGRDRLLEALLVLLAASRK